MKSFVKLLTYIITSTLVLLLVLEFSFTFSYQNPINPRNKPSWLKKMDKENHFDYALFGSSRCLNTVNPVLIDKVTGLSGINMAYNGSNPFEIKLMVHEFIEKYTPKKIYVQVDDRYNRERNDPTSSIFWLPFIKQDYLYNEFKKSDSLAWSYKYMPFYRYQLYESKIGIRDVLFSYLKNNNFSEFKGFKPAHGQMEEVKAETKVLEDKPNIHLKEIEKMCCEKGIAVYFFTAPYYKFKINTEVLYNNLGNYKDFSGLLQNYKLYQNRGHLNEKGAGLFTQYFIKNYFAE